MTQSCWLKRRIERCVHHTSEQQRGEFYRGDQSGSLACSKSRNGPGGVI